MAVGNNPQPVDLRGASPRRPRKPPPAEPVVVHQPAAVVAARAVQLDRSAAPWFVGVSGELLLDALHHVDDPARVSPAARRTVLQTLSLPRPGFVPPADRDDEAVCRLAVRLARSSCDPAQLLRCDDVAALSAKLGSAHDRDAVREARRLTRRADGLRFALDDRAVDAARARGPGVAVGAVHALAGGLHQVALRLDVDRAVFMRAARACLGALAAGAARPVLVTHAFFVNTPPKVVAAAFQCFAADLDAAAFEADALVVPVRAADEDRDEAPRAKKARVAVSCASFHDDEFARASRDALDLGGGATLLALDPGQFAAAVARVGALAEET